MNEREREREVWFRQTNIGLNDREREGVEQTNTTLNDTHTHSRRIVDIPTKYPCSRLIFPFTHHPVLTFIFGLIFDLRRQILWGPENQERVGTKQRLMVNSNASSSFHSNNNKKAEGCSVSYKKRKVVIFQVIFQVIDTWQPIYCRFSNEPQSTTFCTHHFFQRKRTITLLYTSCYILIQQFTFSRKYRTLFVVCTLIRLTGN